MTLVNAIVRDLNRSVDDAEKKYLDEKPDKKTKNAILGVTEESRDTIERFSSFFIVASKKQAKEILEQIFIYIASQKNKAQKEGRSMEKDATVKLMLLKDIEINNDKIMGKLKDGDYDEFFV